MKLKFLFSVFIFYSVILFSTSSPKDDAKKVKNLVIDDGYPFETHYVETEDGYILEMHRIPGSRGSNINENGKYSVLLKHGLGECSALFLLGGPNRSLAYILADKGYDVWLGNSRGNRFSRNHTNLPVSSFGFWNFSWHEIGLYDDSAMMDYVLKETGHQKIFYICHSEGCTELYVLVSLKPHYNDKMYLAVNLGPAVFMGNISGIARLGAEFSYILSFIFEKMGHVNMLDGSTWLRIVTNFFCSKGMITQPICMLVVFLAGGFSPSEADTNIFGKFLTYFPSGGSSKQLIHYGFGLYSPAEFRHYDYGTTINKKIYNSSIAPKYPLEKATLPVAIFYGSRDYLAAAEDVKLLVRTLPKVIYSRLVDGFNHFDFLIGINAPNKVYVRIYELMETFKNK